MAVPIDVDDMIVRLLNVGVPGCALVNNVKETELLGPCQTAKELLLNQASLIEVQSPIKVCGDIHGQYADVLRLFDRGGFPPMVNYLFHGDYVDRGHQNLECMALFFAYKIKYPLNFFILRRSYECAAINRVYGFYEESNRRYNSIRLWLSFQDPFAAMPFTTPLIAGRILCMHGGLSPMLKSLAQLRQITRPIDPPIHSLRMDLLWSDPDQYVKGWQVNARGVSYVFGKDLVHKMIRALDIDLIIRAHEVVQDGYEFFANKRLVTISASHYCGQFDNAAAMVKVDERFVCSFQVMRPKIKEKKTSFRAN